VTLCEELFEAVGGCEKTQLKGLPTTWSWEEIRLSFLTTQSHPKQWFHILNVSNKILRTRASNRFPNSLSSELWSSEIQRCVTHEQCGETAPYSSRIQKGLILWRFVLRRFTFTTLVESDRALPTFGASLSQTQASFVHLVRFQLFSGVHVFLLFLF